MTRHAQTLSRLTSKQRDVLALVADNRTSKEIAVQLGISESAVNQRIEMVRARLGGLPRGQLARLYRLEYSGDTASPVDETLTWQKIHLPPNLTIGNDAAAGSISQAGSSGSHQDGTGEGDGSQLTAVLFQPDDNWLWRDNRVTAFVRFAAVSAIILAALLIAVAVTSALGPVGG
jgi:DNA-binding CsgD family transcriptional regulator